MAARKKKAAKKAVKKKVVKKKVVAKAPEELEHMWDEDTQKAWGKLNQKQQGFFIAWMNNGYNAAEAYRTVVNPLADTSTAGTSGHRLLTNVDIQELASKISESKKTDLIAIKKVYYDGLTALKPHFAKGKDSDGNDTFENVGELEDHATRLKAAEGLAKLNGELTDRTEGSIKFTGDVTINMQVIGEMNQFLAKAGHKPIVQRTKPNVSHETITPVIEEEDDFESFGDDNMRVVE